MQLRVRRRRPKPNEPEDTPAAESKKRTDGKQLTVPPWLPLQALHLGPRMPQSRQEGRHIAGQLGQFPVGRGLPPPQLFCDAFLEGRLEACQAAHRTHQPWARRSEWLGKNVE